MTPSPTGPARAASRPALLVAVALMLLAGGGLAWSLVRARSTGPAAPRPGASPPNVLIVMWDTVRADRLGCYGYARPTTPRLDAFARESTLYEYVVSPSPWTIPTHASIFTGLYPSAHGAERVNKWLHDDYVTLAERFRDAGYDTFMFSANPFVSREINLAQGFDTAEFPWEPKWQPAVRQSMAARADAKLRVWDHDEARQFKEAADVIADGLLQWLDARPTGRPFFAFLNFMEAHAPWYPTRAERARFLTPELVEHSYLVDVSHVTRTAYIFGCLEYSRTDIEAIGGLYDASVWRLDDVTGRLMDELKRRGRWDDTVVVVVSDHGDNLGEHHMLDHEYCVYNTLTRVPLIVRYPPAAGVRPGRIATPVQTHDLFPTLLELAGIPDPHPQQTQAHSLLRPASHGRPLISEYLTPKELGVRLVARSYPIADPQRWLRKFRSLERDGWKFIWSSDGRHEIYHVAADPGETRDRATAEPNRAAAMLAELEDWLDSFEHFNPARHRWRKTPQMSPEALKRLESLGYLTESPDND